MAREFDWVAVADAIGTSAHSLAGSMKIREVMATVGITGLPLSPHEALEAKNLRVRAANCIYAAEQIEARAVTDDER